MNAVTGREPIAAAVGGGIREDEGRFRAAAAWAWAWRSFDLSLPDVGGAAWQTDPAGSRDEGELPSVVRDPARAVV